MLNAWHRKTWAALAALAGLCLLLAGASAAPRRVEAFDTAAWPALQAGLKMPTVLVFSTTDCAHCPAVFRRLGQDIHQRQGQGRASLVAVVMDAAPGDDDAALVHDPRYQPADWLLVFSGQAPALRYAVDPRWRGITPFVVFLSPQAPQVFVTGPRKPAQIAAWLRAAAPAKPH